MYLNKRDLQTEYVGIMRKRGGCGRIHLGLVAGLREKKASREEKNENHSMSDAGMVNPSISCEGETLQGYAGDF
jgi:hypothetical protein